MKRVAIYVRVSTDEQAKEGFSIEGQKDKLISYCKAKDWIIQDMYVDDGYTGTNTDRPALQSLLKNMDKFDVVLVYKLDRLSRNQRDVLELVEGKLLENNVEFVSLLESFDTSSPFGRAMLGILAVFAQLDREMIIERMKLGKERRAKEGYWGGGGNLPIGYSYDNDELTIDPYEAMQVRKVFKLYLEGKGAESIAEYMTSKGYKNNNGYKWNSQQVLRTLKNQIYIGMIEHNGEHYKGRHKPIIDKDVFNMTQATLDKYKKKPKSNKYLLGGIVYCKYCGARLRATWTRTGKEGKIKTDYYCCYSVVGHKRMAKTDDCIGRNWRAEELEGEVINQLGNKELNISKLEKAYEIKKGYLENKESQQDVIMNKIRDIDNNIDKLMKLYQDDKIPVSIISERIDKLYKEKTELQNSVIEVIEDPVDDNFQMYMTWLKNFNAIWEEANFEEKRVMITSLIKRIDVGNTRNEVYITWNDL